MLIAYAQVVAAQLDIRVEQTAAAIELLEAANRALFFAHYRKEATRSLDEEKLRKLSELFDRLCALVER